MIVKLLLKRIYKLLNEYNYKITTTNTYDNIDDKIKIIIESWRSVCLEHSKSAFEQAGFYIESCYKNKQQATDFVKNNKISKVLDIHLLLPVVKFDLSLARELKPIIDPKNEISRKNTKNKERINVEEDEEKKED